MRADMTIPRYSFAVLMIAGFAALCLYLFSATQGRVDAEALAVSPESERLREELVKLSGDLDASSLEGRACRADIAGFLYALRTDSVARRLAFQAEAAWQTHSRALVLAALVLGVAGLILGTVHLARPAEDGGAKGAGAAAALGAAVLALGVLAVALSLDRRGQSFAPAPALNLDLAAFVERCEDYRRSEE